MRQSHVVDDVTNAAVELFAAQGYAKTSVQQIVTAAGVTKGAMYHYFTSKDDLLFGIYDQLLTMQKSKKRNLTNLLCLKPFRNTLKGFLLVLLFDL